MLRKTPSVYQERENSLFITSISLGDWGFLYGSAWSIISPSPQGRALMRMHKSESAALPPEMVMLVSA